MKEEGRGLFMSYGTINLYENKLLFFGGQAKKGKKKEPEEEDEGEEEEEDGYESDKLPYDTIFEILDYMDEKSVMRVTMVSKSWTFSIAARTDRIWSPKYKHAIRNTKIRAYDLKKVKRKKTAYEKFSCLRYHEMVMGRVRTFTSKKVKVRGNIDTDHVKIVVVGDGAVGKTCLLIVYADESHEFPTSYVPTVFDNYNATINVDGRDVGMSLWDTAGEEDYDELRPLSYTGASLFLVCASCANPVSLSNIKCKWIPEVRKYNRKTPVFLVLTKCDLRGDKHVLEDLRESNQDFVRFDDAVKMAKDVGAAGVYETSAYTGKGVKKVFDAAINLTMFGSTESGDKCGIM